MKWSRSAAALAALTTLALTGCSGGSLSGTTEETEGTAVEGLTEIVVGVLPTAAHAAMQLGLDEGIFAEHGLDVELQQNSGPGLVPALTSGSIDFVVGSPLSALTAIGQGLDIQILTGYSRNSESPDSPEDEAPSGLSVRADQGIESWKDLEGKTVAINALNSQGDLGIKAMVEADGGDPSKVTFIEVAFADQLAQLEQGHIDAAWAPEPFLSQARASEGIEFLGDPMKAIDGLANLVTFTSGSYADAHPETVDAFMDAIAETTAAAMADDEKLRATIVDYTGMSAEVVEGINLEYYTAEVDREMLTELIALAYRFDFIKAEPSLDDVVRSS